MDIQDFEGYSLFQLINEYILEDNITNIELIINKINFNAIDLKDINTLFFHIFSGCYQYNRYELAKNVYNLNYLFYPSYLEMSYLTTLFLDFRSNAVVMSFLVKALNIFTFIEIIYDIIKLGNNSEYRDSELYSTCYKIYQSFGEQNVELYNQLYDMAVGKSAVVANFLAERRRKINKFADIPIWMIGTEILPKESNVLSPEAIIKPSVVEKKMPPLDDIMKLLEKDIIKNININMPDVENPEQVVKDIFRVEFIALSLLDKYRILEPYIKFKNLEALQYDSKLFIILGPAASFINADEEQLQYGGPRMLEYNKEIDYVLDPDEDYTKDWFTGYCIECDLRIRRRWHAVRMPQKYGGWDGCYCCWSCVRDSIERFEKDDIVLLNTLVDLYEQQINNYGILDRIPDNEYDDYISKVIPSKIDELSPGSDIRSSLPETEDKRLLKDVPAVIQPEQIIVDKKFADITILMFYKSDCLICEQIIPQLDQYEQFLTTTKSLLINKINIDNLSNIEIQKYNITAVPTFVIFLKEVPYKKLVGSDMRQLNSIINEIIS